MTAGLPYYVPLQRSSDIIFLQWQQQCADAGVGVGNLNSFFRVAVATASTTGIMNFALSSSLSTLDNWNSRTCFYKGSADYNALIGTPHGEVRLEGHKATPRLALLAPLLQSLTVSAGSSMVSDPAQGPDGHQDSSIRVHFRTGTTRAMLALHDRGLRHLVKSPADWFVFDTAGCGDRDGAGCADLSRALRPEPGRRLNPAPAETQELA